MSELQNDLLLRALLRQPTSRTPLWIMRQAGRYLPEYRATRAEAGDFMSLCRNPDLACEVTMQPLRRYALDAAILFSDILTVPDAMGLGLYFIAGEGPKFKNPVQTADAIRGLRVPDVEKELGKAARAGNSRSSRDLPRKRPKSSTSSWTRWPRQRPSISTHRSKRARRLCRFSIPGVLLSNPMIFVAFPWPVCRRSSTA
jgi:hypothetical protein